MNKLKLFLIILLSVFVKPVFANTSEEVKYLAMAIFYEAQGESHAGKEAVADVVLNRVDHPEFANSVKKVITSRGQFQWYHNRSLRGGRVFNPSKEKEIMILAKKKYMQHVMDVRKDTTKKAIFFSTGRKPAPRARLIKKVGNHYLFALRSKTQRS